MRIEASQLSLDSTHQLTQVNALIRQQQVQVRLQPAGDSVSLSAKASLCADQANETEDPRLRLLKYLVEMLSGKKIKGFAQQRALPRVSSSGSNRAVAVEVATRRVELHAESEQTTFAAQGTVRTSDGRTIDFSAKMLMSRQSVSLQESTAAAATDPLVVNLDGAPAQVTSAKIDFDLNSDGRMEKMSFLSGNSGFLALDRNGDGTVNDGSELFGTKTGNAYAELAAYDSDGNGWIDEADPVFAELSVWTAGGLTSLQRAGIGAISTASVGTEFSLKDSNNVLDAQIRRSGVYLFETGMAGTTQQVDLVTTQ